MLTQSRPWNTSYINSSDSPISNIRHGFYTCDQMRYKAQSQGSKGCMTTPLFSPPKQDKPVCTKFQANYILRTNRQWMLYVVDSTAFMPAEIWSPPSLASSVGTVLRNNPEPFRVLFYARASSIFRGRMVFSTSAYCELSTRGRGKGARFISLVRWSRRAWDHLQNKHPHLTVENVSGEGKNRMTSWHEVSTSLIPALSMDS